MRAPRVVELQELGRLRRKPPPRQRRVERLRIVADRFDVVHGRIPISGLL